MGLKVSAPDLHNLGLNAELGHVLQSRFANRGALGGIVRARGRFLIQ